MSKMPQSESVTHSFVIRLWQESSGRWRGVIRHVQSDAQRGVTKLDETMRFIEERISKMPAAQASKPAKRPAFHLNWMPSRQMRLVGVALSVVIVAVITILIAGPVSNTALPGAALGNPVATDTWLSFLAGVIIGAGGLAGLAWLIKH